MSSDGHDLSRLTVTEPPRPDKFRQAILDTVLRSFTPPLSLLLGDARVLVTGARGFFGRYVVDVLLQLNRTVLAQQPVQIHAMDSGVVGGREVAHDWLNHPNLTQHWHDVRHEIGVSEFGGQLPTHVWHLAGIASPYWYKRLPEETISVAVDGTRAMLELARRAKAKFLFTSSSEVYQTADVVPTPEHYVGAIPSLTDRSAYDCSKLLAETLCYVAATKHGQHCTVLRLFNSFGPGQSEQDRRILPRIMSAAKAKRTINVFKDSNRALPRRTYTPVANTLLGFFIAAVRGDSVGSPSRYGITHSSGVYNIGLDSPEVTVPELVHMVSRVAGVDLWYSITRPPEHYETEPLRRCPDISRIRTLGWMPCMGLEDGLRIFSKWAMETYEGIE